jgi:predicted RNA-binding Zn-ribbon protein involved in translation (DUF1610 family)
MKTPIIVNLAGIHKEPDPEQLKENAIQEHAKHEAEMHEHYISVRREQLSMYDNDVEKKNRRAEQLCRYCYYTGKYAMAGQAFTDALCVDCGKQMTFATTSTDWLCPDCAKKRNLCKHCGAEMD